MGGINSIQALQPAINALNQTKEDSDDNRPRAKWRSLEEFKRLSKEAKCIRCTSKAHKSRLCPKYRAAIKPTAISHLNSTTNSNVSREPADLNNESLEDSEVSGEE